MMRNICPRLTVAIGLVCLALAPTVVAAGPAAASVSARAVQLREARNYLSAHPGGRLINDNQISYGDGAFIVTLREPVQTLGTADCPLGWFCFYDRTRFGYPRGQLKGCGRQNLSTWNWQFRIESAQYSIGSGSVAFYYGNHWLFEIGAANRVRSDTSPFRNEPNYVQHNCPNT